MTHDYWKLPKEVRSTVTMKVVQLEHKIITTQTEVNRLSNQLSYAKFELEKATKELTLLQKEYNLNSQ
jgi:uncharacterized membrane protein YjjP (DUF1212 family)